MKKSHLKSFIVISIILSVTVFVLFGGIAQAEFAKKTKYTLKYGHGLPPDNPYHLGAVRFAELCEVYSRGEIEVKDIIDDVTSLEISTRPGGKIIKTIGEPTETLAGKVKAGLNYGWYATSFSEYPEEVVEVMAEFTSYEYNNMVFELVGMIPATTNWDNTLIKDEEILKILAQIDEEGTAPQLFELYPTSATWEALVKNYSLYLLGEITGEEFGEAIDASRG